MRISSYALSKFPASKYCMALFHSATYTTAGYCGWLFVEGCLGGSRIRFWKLRRILYNNELIKLQSVSEDWNFIVIILVI
jgi:hypothetical protein